MYLEIWESVVEVFLIQKMFQLLGVAESYYLNCQQIKCHCYAQWDIIHTLVQLLALVNSYLPDWPWLWSSPEHWGCQETWYPVSTSSLLPGCCSVLSLLCLTCLYCRPSNTSVYPSLLSLIIKWGSFFLAGSLYCTEILSLWTFDAMIMGNVFEPISHAAFCN